MSIFFLFSPSTHNSYLAIVSLLQISLKKLKEHFYSLFSFGFKVNIENNNSRQYEFLGGENSCISHSKCRKENVIRNHSYKSTTDTADTSFVLFKYFKVTPANNSVKYLSGTTEHQYLTTISTLRDGRANYYILPLEKSSPVHLLIISQSVSCCC